MKTFKSFLLLFITISINLSVSGQAVVTIPVVVHVLWHDSAANIPDANIYDQIRILNEDFRKLNPDTVSIPVPFRQYAGDALIEFCLAQRDPNGNTTTGITRTYTSIYGPINFDTIPHTALGGEDSWNYRKYLNIWVTKMTIHSIPIIGAAKFPAALLYDSAADGIYVDPDYFGSIGVANNNYEGREAIHLLGNWLNLLFTGAIYGGGCYDDGIADTPPVEAPFASGCVSFPYRPNDACGTDNNGEMTSNIMASTDVACRNFFTNGQIAIMHNCLDTIRSGLLTSDGCMPVGINEWNKMNVSLFPNPTTGVFSLTIDNVKQTRVEIYNVVGKVIYQSLLTSTQGTIDLAGEPPGVYIVQLANESERYTKKIVKE